MTGRHLHSTSVVIVIRDVVPSPDIISRLSLELERYFTDFEYIFIANETAPEMTLALKSLVEQVPDSLAVFLSERVHDDVARLVGIDHAVSDYVLYCTPTESEIATLSALIRPAFAGCDLVTGEVQRAPLRPLGRRVLHAIFRLLYRGTTGKVYEPWPAAFRLLSRAAALYVATRPDGEALIRARTLSAGFPSASVHLPAEGSLVRERSSMMGDMVRGTRLIATSSTMLLRTSSYIAAAGGLLSGVYAIYVILAYLLLPFVQPGWTTTSLQLSGMMLLFSIQFLLLSEHVIQIAANNPSSNRRHLVIRELRGSLSRRSARLNVVAQEGEFQLGAPKELVAAQERFEG